MPDLINTAKHIKENARKAKSHTRKVQHRIRLNNLASMLPSTVKPGESSSSTGLVVCGATSLTTGMSRKTISKKKLIKRQRNDRYLTKSQAAIAAAIGQDIDEMNVDTEDSNNLSSNQRKIRARNEANRIAKEQALAFAQILAAPSAIAPLSALQGGMEIETSGNGTTLGRPRYI